MTAFRIYPLYVETFRDASYTRARFQHHKALRFTRDESTWTRHQAHMSAKRLGLHHALQMNCRFSEPNRPKPQHMSYEQFQLHVLQESEE